VPVLPFKTIALYLRGRFDKAPFQASAFEFLPLTNVLATHRKAAELPVQFPSYLVQGGLLPSLALHLIA
jgi:hypothetical protein